MRYFILVLFFVVVASYVQILGMHVWQDDNGLFFKLAHIEENAGYFGAGPFGVGTYKYTITPYIPIYKIFGYNTLPYFFLNLVLYFLTTICVYKVFSKIIGKKGGKIAGFLYGAGYIASDGFIRLFSSPIFSLSIIFVSVFLLSYWNYYKEKRIKWYFLTVLFFFLAIEFARARTHYLIGVVVLFELIFFVFKKPLKSIFASLSRLIPFVVIFYQYFVVNADARSGQVKAFILSLIQGDFQKLYGFVSAWANLILPDWLTGKFFLIGNRPAWLITSLLLAVVLVLILRRNLKRRILSPLFISVLVAWAFASRTIFVTKLLNLSTREIFIAFLGGSLIIIFFSAIFTLKRFRNLYLLLLGWAFLNILAYSAYNPTVSYESVNRYLTHSFFPLVGMLGIFSINAGNKISNVAITGLIMFWGLGNMVNAAVYQNRILKERSGPAREFYEQLKVFVPLVEKGDAFYFDVATSDKSYFNDAFSVASMPETTAIAWRYGVDRYDIKLFTDFNELSRQINEGEVDQNRLHTFWYSGKKLSDTTPIIADYFLGRIPKKSITLDKLLISGWKNKEIEIDLREEMISSVPLEISFDIQASFPDLDVYDFPLVSKDMAAKEPPDTQFLQSALAYGRQKRLAGSVVTASSSWRERRIENLNDSDVSTIWQPDRIKFRGKNEWFQIDLGGIKNVSKLVWINGFGNNTPIRYKVEVSKDGSVWTTTKEIDSVERIDVRSPRVISFVPIDTRFVRMTIMETLNGDSPGIAEAWVVSSNFEELDITAAENFLSSPFSYVADLNSFNILKNFLAGESKVKVYWQISDGDLWVSTETSYINLINDGRQREYLINIPPRGQTIKKIKLADFSAPSDIVISGLEVRWPRP